MNTYLALMLAAHALCDYPLQGDWLSKAKNHNFVLTKNGLEHRDKFMSVSGPEFVYPKGSETIWPGALAAHAAIHGAAVYMITGSPILGVLEFVAHALIDFTKCEGLIGYNIDQTLHVLCKVLWMVCLLYWGLGW